MASTAPPPDEQPESDAPTLGDLLYANPAKPRVSERAWVELVQAIARGDQLALHGLYRQTHRLVFTLTMRISGSRETAEELTLDVFHDVWRRAATYDPAGGSVIGWIMNQARSRAIDRLRFEQRKKRVNSFAEEPVLTAAARGPQETVELQQQARLLRQAMAGLSPHEREAIEKAFFSELTYTEVAARLDEPVGTVKTRIRTGLQKLRKAMTGEAER